MKGTGKKLGENWNGKNVNITLNFLFSTYIIIHLKLKTGSEFLNSLAILYSIFVKNSNYKQKNKFICDSILLCLYDGRKDEV